MFDKHLNDLQGRMPSDWFSPYSFEQELDACIALKRCRVSSEMTAKHKDRWVKEIDIMLRLNHPNVVNAVQVPEELVDAHESLPYLGMEYCSGGDLRKVGIYI